MKPIVTVGVIIALLGVLGLAIPEFTTNETKNVVTLGDLKVQATEPTSHSVPPILSGGRSYLAWCWPGAASTGSPDSETWPKVECRR